jgi:hypothetical protein
MIGEEGPVQLQALLFQYAYGDLHACIAQLLYTLSVHLVKTVATADDHTGYPFLHDEVGTGGCLPIVGAGLKTYIHGGFAQQLLVLDCCYGVHFGVRTSALAVVSFTDNLILVHDDGSHHGVGGRFCAPTPCQL